MISHLEIDMPIYKGKNSKGHFYQWGKDMPGHKKWAKYYYNPESKRSIERAKDQAISQGLAAKASQGR